LAFSGSSNARGQSHPPAVLFRSRAFLVANILTLFLYGALAACFFSCRST